MSNSDLICSFNVKKYNTTIGGWYMPVICQTILVYVLAEGVVDQYEEIFPNNWIYYLFYIDNIKIWHYLCKKSNKLMIINS